MNVEWKFEFFFCKFKNAIFSKFFFILNWFLFCFLLCSLQLLLLLYRNNTYIYNLLFWRIYCLNRPCITYTENGLFCFGFIHLMDFFPFFHLFFFLRWNNNVEPVSCVYFWFSILLEKWRIIFFVFFFRTFIERRRNWTWFCVLQSFNHRRLNQYPQKKNKQEEI